jgi:hypothetical protein
MSAKRPDIPRAPRGVSEKEAVRGVLANEPPAWGGESVGGRSRNPFQGHHYLSHGELDGQTAKLWCAWVRGLSRRPA